MGIQIELSIVRRAHINYSNPFSLPQITASLHLSNSNVPFNHPNRNVRATSNLTSFARSISDVLELLQALT